MKHIILIFLIIFSIQINGQNLDLQKQFRIELLAIEKRSENILHSSIIEIFSGGKRIDANITDFDGIAIFKLNNKDISNSKIKLKIKGIKCNPFEKEILLIDDIKMSVFLKYGKSEYTNVNQLDKIIKSLNIKFKDHSFMCGTVDD